MKIFIYILIVIALAIIGLNIYHVDYKNFFSEENYVPFIGIFASICAILILLLLKNSKKLMEKINGKN